MSGIGPNLKGFNQNFFQKLTFNNTVFNSDPDIIILKQFNVLSLVNEGATAYEVSFNGNYVHSDQIPSTPTQSLTITDQSVTKLWFRLKTAGTGTVRIETNAIAFGIPAAGSSAPSGPAGGDLSGTYPSPTVSKIDGASVPAAGSLTTGNVLQVSGASALSYGPVNLAGGANFVTGSLPAGNQASQTVGGDLSGTTAAAIVASITGTSGTVSVGAAGGTTGNILSWTTATTSPTIKQSDLTTNSGTGQALLIQAQNETGTTSTGGQLTLTSGTGTTAAGNILLQTGGTTKITISPTINTFVNTLSITALTVSNYVKTDGSKNLVSSATIGIADLTIGSQAQGDVIYYNGTSWTRLGAGTAGMMLQTNGASANPSWNASQLRTISFTTGTGATANSTTNLPPNAIVKECWFKITTSYSAGATLKIGYSGTTNAFFDTTTAPPDGDITTSVGDIYIKQQLTTSSGSAVTVLATIGGSPASGAGVAYIVYSLPDA